MFIAVLVFVPLALFFLRRGRGPRPQGTTGPVVPVGPTQPAADQPTPDVRTPRERDGSNRVPPG